MVLSNPSNVYFCAEILNNKLWTKARIIVKTIY